MKIRSARVVRALGIAVGLAVLPPGSVGLAAEESGPVKARGRLGWLQQAVGLTDQQVEAIRAATGPLRDQMWQARLALGEARAELRAAMAQEPPNLAAVQTAKDKVKALLAQRLDLSVDLRLAVRQQLTREQREELTRLFAERRARWFRPHP
jgi:Spy/CpxP family protein refolding chaperone